MNKNWVIGIDLGTSNSCVSIGLLDDQEPVPTVLNIPQIFDATRFDSLPLLPSAVYIPTIDEYQSGNFPLPWGKKVEPYIIGSYARERGALSPDRLIVSAKSWLSNSRVDRKGNILPFPSGSLLEEEKISPYSATVEYLKHIYFAICDHLKGDGLTRKLLSSANVVVTVPASFDEVARKLTQDAAIESGFHKVTLLEEPLAAFYDWISSQGNNWRKQVASGDIVLVCDVGGGTADFSLIAVLEKEGELELKRISVGDHILLGGDNMDLAIAHLLREKLSASGKSIDDWTFLSLIYQSRIAKEKLLSTDSEEKINITLPSRGSDLFANPLSIDVTKAEIISLVVDGFFPLVTNDTKPKKNRSSGLREIGLPFEADPALTAHLAGFLQLSFERLNRDEELKPLLDSAYSTGDFIVKPSAILFNGGVFKSSVLRNRLLKLVSEWSQNSVRELLGGDLDLSVSKGACIYSYKKTTGEGWRIRSGTLKSYYIGIESSQPAVPGLPNPLKGLCILPKGAEEGTNFSLADSEFALDIGEVVEFRLFTSSDRESDTVGLIINDAVKNLVEIAPIKTKIDFPTQSFLEENNDFVTVKLNASISETGVLQIIMNHTNSAHRWELELDVRATENTSI
jgi:Hsp70 protein